MAAMKCSAVRNPKDRWLMDLILLFIPSTAPLDMRCLVHARIPSRSGNRVQSCTRKGGPQTLSPITFVLLRAASGPLDELQAAASGMPVGKLDVFLNAAESGDFLPHAWQSLDGLVAIRRQ